MVILAVKLTEAFSQILRKSVHVMPVRFILDEFVLNYRYSM